MAVLKAQNISLSYNGNADIIHELNVEIPAGKVTALVGPNGCGKSTLLRGLSRLLAPKQGTVLLDGEDVHRMKTRSLAQKMGILPQAPVAPEGLTVYELVSQGRYPHQSWFRQWSAADEQATQEALHITGMTDFAERPVDTLSGGQRQRAWIAMALAQDTDVLLLDEPTTYLDMAYQIDVLDLLSELNQNQGRTIVMVLHDLNQAARYVDYLIAMRDGAVVATGTSSEVMTESTVRQVFGINCQIVPDPLTGTPMCIPVGRGCKFNPVINIPLNRHAQDNLASQA